MREDESSVRAPTLLYECVCVCVCVGVTGVSVSGGFRSFGLKCGGRVLMCSGTPGCRRHPVLSAAFRPAAEMKDRAPIKQTG